MRYWIMIVLLGLTTLAWTNETVVAVGQAGRIHRIRGKSTTVRLVREWVNIDVFPDTQHFQVQFVFHNDGPATTVTMGFPEGGIITHPHHSGFQSFRYWVDGREVKAIRKLADLEKYGENADGSMEYFYDAYWVNKVPFARNQQRIVRVEYSAPPMVSVEEGFSVSRYDIYNQSAKYDFTGGNWKGEVDESDLRVSFHLPGTYVIYTDTPMTQHGNTFAYCWTHWQAEEDFHLSYYPTYPDAMLLRCPGNDFPSYFITMPGKAKDELAAPEIIEKQGVVFISLRQLMEFMCIGDNGDLPFLRNLDWDDATRTATLSVGDQVLHCTVNNPIMRMDGKPDVTLPAAPFLRPTIFQEGIKINFLYVPLLPIVQALDARSSIDETHRIVTLTFKNEATVEKKGIY